MPADIRLHVRTQAHDKGNERGNALGLFNQPHTLQVPVLCLWVGHVAESAWCSQALECNAQGRKVVQKGKKKKRPLYFRLIRPASGLHAHDMDGRGELPGRCLTQVSMHAYMPCWKDY